MIRISIIRSGVQVLAVLVSSAIAAAAAAGTCDVDSIKKIAPADAVIDSVKAQPGPVAHCEVLGHTITQNPGPNQVNWSVLLPDNRFNGRYYFVGEGGGAGFVPTAASLGESGNAGYVMSTLKLLSEGFVVAGTDTGHKGSLWDFGANNPTLRLDYGHRGAHVSAVATQAITRAYYGMKDKLYRYHLGCSGGGRMGMMAAYHHPEDYDGIVASTVARGGGSLEFAVISQYIVRHPEAWISPQKLAFMERKVNEKCAGPDGLVRDPYGCGFDVTALQCKGADNAECLTAAEISSVKLVTGRFHLGTTEDAQVPGFSISNPTGWATFLMGMTRPTGAGGDNPWAPASPPASFIVAQSLARGFYFDDVKFDVIKDLDLNSKEVLARLDERHPVWSVTTPDLAGYKKAGGKLIMWAGLSENAVPPATEIEYFAAIKKAVPKAEDFVQLYLAPGVLHCLGGPGPQDVEDRLLETVIAWVEEGKRPGPVVTSASSPHYAPPPTGPGHELTAPPPSRTVLLCPAPQTAVFTARKGALAFDAANWKCQ